MALSSASAISKNVKSGDIAGIYYFYGHDVAALESFTKKLVARLCPADAQFMNLHKFDGRKLDIAALADACEALPMFAQRVVITINDLKMEDIPKQDGDDLRRILSGLSDTTTVIIYATGISLYKNKRSLTDKNKRFCDFCAKHGEACEFAYKRPAEHAKGIAAQLTKNGCTINRRNAEYIAAVCLCDSANIKQEINKLSAYAHGREITREDIDLLCIKHIESDGYDLALNILNNNAGAVFNRLQELANQNYDAYEIVGIIGFSLTDIYRAKLGRSLGLDYKQIAADFNYPPNREFAVKNAYSACGNISVGQIRETLEIFSQADLKLKTAVSGKDSAMLTLERAAARCLTLSESGKRRQKYG